MKNSCIVLLLLLSCLASVCAQEKPPSLLMDAAHCLAAKHQGWQDWLDLENSKATTLSLGYVVDTESYLGEKVLYVVSYSGPSRSEGLVFTIFLEQRDRREVFNIQNNAKFAKSKDVLPGIKFVEPPLGGTWTQQHLVSAIKRIERRPKFVVPVKDVLATSTLGQCESYADKK